MLTKLSGLSTCPLSILSSLIDTEGPLLKKGLNFTVTPANIPATEIIAKVESAARQLHAERADAVRRAVNISLQQAEPPKPNIKKEGQIPSVALKRTVPS